MPKNIYYKLCINTHRKHNPYLQLLFDVPHKNKQKVLIFKASVQVNACQQQLTTLKSTCRLQDWPRKSSTMAVKGLTTIYTA